MQGILEKLQADAAQMPNRPVYDFLDCAQTPFSHDRVTMGQLYRRAMDLAAELRRRGAKPGDRAIILSLQDAGTVYPCIICAHSACHPVQFILIIPVVKSPSNPIACLRHLNCTHFMIFFLRILFKGKAFSDDLIGSQIFIRWELK